MGDKVLWASTGLLKTRLWLLLKYHDHGFQYRVQLSLSCLINSRDQDNKVALIIFIVITYYLPVLIGILKVLVPPYVLYGFFPASTVYRL
jgi:hypothetical protein